MVRESGSRGKISDIQAVLGIARTLLDLKGPSGGRGTMGLLAHDFTQAPPTVTIEELLEVRRSENSPSGSASSNFADKLYEASLSDLWYRTLVSSASQYTLYDSPKSKPICLDQLAASIVPKIHARILLPNL
jgi:hypothetical protein